MTTLTAEYDNFPVWSPRGDLIAFARKVDGDFEVFTIRPDGNDLRRQTYTSAPQPYGELFVMRYDGKQVEQLTDNQWEDVVPAWQPRKK